MKRHMKIVWLKNLCSTFLKELSQITENLYHAGVASIQWFLKIESSGTSYNSLGGPISILVLSFGRSIKPIGKKRLRGKNLFYTIRQLDRLVYTQISRCGPKSKICSIEGLSIKEILFCSKPLKRSGSMLCYHLMCPYRIPSGGKSKNLQHSY